MKLGILRVLVILATENLLINRPVELGDDRAFSIVRFAQWYALGPRRRGDDTNVAKLASRGARQVWTFVSLNDVEMLQTGQHVAAFRFMAFELDPQAQIVHAVGIA